MVRSTVDVSPRGHSSRRIVWLSPNSLIPSTFGGLHTVYASCSLPEPCFFTVLTPAAKRKIGSDNPLCLPELLPLNEHILLPGVKLISVILESNKSSKAFCSPQRAKIVIRLGFTAVPEPPHIRALAILPDSKAFAEPAQSADEPEGPNLPLAQALLQPDTVQFRHDNEAIEFPSAAGS
ncbi:hypothetical protein HispidOSU_031368 [Sigmodon hispidus]